MNILVIVALVISSVLLIVYSQHKMIYYPRPYSDELWKLSDDFVEIEYSIDQGAQVAFYVPPKEGPKPKRPRYLWVLFGGNATLALDWYDFVQHYPEPHSGFLLVDYPGYGKCSGRASDRAILKSSIEAFSALADYLKISPEELSAHANVLGHSLGAAAALQFSINYPINKLILIAPFTSLRDMANKVVGKALASLLLHNYDNRARIVELVGRENPPAITIIHGALDTIVPVAMGRELAGMSDLIDYQEINNGDHNLILTMEEKRIHAAMLGEKTGR